MSNEQQKPPDDPKRRYLRSRWVPRNDRLPKNPKGVKPAHLVDNRTEAQRKEIRAQKARRIAEAREKMRQVSELKLQGLTFAQIGKVLGFHASIARKWYLKALADIPAETAGQLRTQYLQRTDRAIKACFRVMESDEKRGASLKERLQAAAIIVTIETSRARVLGFEQPLQHRHGGAAGAPAIMTATAIIPMGQIAELSDDDLADLQRSTAQTFANVSAAAAASSGAGGGGATPTGRSPDGDGSG